MKPMKWLVSCGLAAALIVAPATAAQAESVPGGCSKSGYTGNGVTHYAHIGTVFRITKFEYRLSHSSTRSSSNVNIKHKENRNNRPDREMYAWNSPDNREFNRLYSHEPEVTLELSHLKAMYTNYEFIFDKLGPDPKCTARTADIEA